MNTGMNLQEIRKSIIAESFIQNDLEKGAKANIGEIRTWQGKKVQKQANGEWKEVSEGKEKEVSSDELEDLKSKLSEQEYFRSSEIKTTGFVSGRTFNKITSLNKKIKALETKQETPKSKEDESDVTINDHGVKFSKNILDENIFKKTPEEAFAIFKKYGHGLYNEKIPTGDLGKDWFIDVDTMEMVSLKSDSKQEETQSQNNLRESMSQGVGSMIAQEERNRERDYKSFLREQNKDSGFPPKRKKITKAEAFDILGINQEEIFKAKKANIGEIREWNGKKMQKQANGEWKEVKEGKSGGGEEEENYEEKWNFHSDKANKFASDPNAKMEYAFHRKKSEEYRKKFSDSKQEETFKVHLGKLSGELSEIKIGEKLKLTEAAKTDPSESLSVIRRSKDDTFKFLGMAGGSVRVQGSDGDTHILSAHRFEKKSDSKQEETPDKTQKELSEFEEYVKTIDNNSLDEKFLKVGNALKDSNGKLPKLEDLEDDNDRILRQKLSIMSKELSRREKSDYDDLPITHPKKLENHINENKEEIKDNMKAYGFKRKDLSEIRNYYDMATVLGIDSRELAEADLQQIGNTLKELIKSEKQEALDILGIKN